MRDADDRPSRDLLGARSDLGSDAHLVRSASTSKPVFPCPNGCGSLTQRKCKLHCEACGYFDSCADFC